MGDRPITSTDHLKNFERETALMVEIEPAQLDLPITHLDDWTVRSVLVHASQVLRFGSLCLHAEPDEPPQRSDVAEPPSGDDILPWLRESVTMAHQSLLDVDPQRTCPTWAGPQTASWLLRRLSHEISVHRWDAESAWTEPKPMGTRIALDGIDELLEVLVPGRLDFEQLGGSGETVHLHATDTDDGEWFLTYKEDQLDWAHLHDKADVAAKGKASDLLLMLWGRVSPDDLEVFGDQTLLDRWQEAANF